MDGGPRVSICELTTFPASFDEDLAAYRSAGVKGIGVCETKIAGDPSAVLRLRGSGLCATHCIPAVASILPTPQGAGPEDPEDRIGAICAGIRRLAELEPACCLFLTGPLSGRDDEQERQIVREGIVEIGASAERAGVRVGLEPIHRSQAAALSFVTTIPETVALIEESGARNVGIMFDTWNLWDSPGLREDIRAEIGRIVGVHVADRREPTRGLYDRVLPGDGVIDLATILGWLDEAGFEGWFEIEVFSDNGLLGQALPDSLWNLDATELARRAHDSFLRVWREKP